MIRTRALAWVVLVCRQRGIDNYAVATSRVVRGRGVVTTSFCKCRVSGQTEEVTAVSNGSVINEKQNSPAIFFSFYERLKAFRCQRGDSGVVVAISSLKVSALKQLTPS